MTKNNSMKIASGLPLSYYQNKWNNHLTGKEKLDDAYIKNLKRILANPAAFHIKGA